MAAVSPGFPLTVRGTKADGPRNNRRERAAPMAYRSLRRPLADRVQSPVAVHDLHSGHHTIDEHSLCQCGTAGWGTATGGFRRTSFALLTMPAKCCWLSGTTPDSANLPRGTHREAGCTRHVSDFGAKSVSCRVSGAGSGGARGPGRPVLRGSRGFAVTRDALRTAAKLRQARDRGTRARPAAPPRTRFHQDLLS